jgi:two-component system, NtrC family, sensor histidine kinase KinB
MSLTENKSERTSNRTQTIIIFGAITINLAVGLLLPPIAPLSLVACSVVLGWLAWRSQHNQTVLIPQPAVHEHKLLELSQKMAEHLSSRSDLQTVVETITAHAEVLFGADGVWLLTNNADKQHLRFLTQDEPPNPTAIEQYAQTSLTHQQTEIFQDGTDTAPAGTTICVPLARREGLTEVLCLFYRGQRQWSQRERDVLNRFAVLAAHHLDDAILYESSIVANNRTQALLNSTRDGVLLLDRDGILIECNPSAERLLGIDRETFIGKHFVAMLFQLMQANEVNGLGYSRAQLTHLARQLRTEPERITRRQFERATNLQTIHIEEIGSPLVDQSGQIVGRLLVMRDITEQKMLSEFRNEIMSMAVHDLRSPLAAIISGLSFAMDELQLMENTELMTTTLNWSMESANSLMRLVESLLDINKLENRQITLERVAIDVPALIESAYRALANTIKTADIQFTSVVDPTLPEIHADQELIRRVLLNLLDNAVRYTPSGERVRLTVGIAPADPGKAVFRMADSGPGIAEEERERVFERFRQVKTNVPLRGGKGSGLGLTFCKLAVEAHGGTIWVEADTELPGACFAFTVPVVTTGESKAS